MVGRWAVPARRCAMTRKPSGNIFGFTQRRCEVSDESRERILTLSHSPSVIKPSQAMGVCQVSRAFKLSMSPMCSRAVSDSVRQECGGYHCEFAAGPWCAAHFCTDPFVMCLIYVSKTVQIAKGYCSHIFILKCSFLSKKHSKLSSQQFWVKTATKLYSMSFVIDFQFLWENVSSHKNNLVFWKTFQSSQKHMQKQCVLH